MNHQQQRHSSEGLGAFWFFFKVLSVALLLLRWNCFKKNLNASKPSEHPPQVEEIVVSHIHTSHTAGWASTGMDANPAACGYHWTVQFLFLFLFLFFLSPFAPKNLVLRDRFGRPFPRRPTRSPHPGWIWCLPSTPRLNLVFAHGLLSSPQLAATASIYTVNSHRVGPEFIGSFHNVPMAFTPPAQGQQVLKVVRVTGAAGPHGATHNKLTTSRIGNLTRLIHTLLCMMTTMNQVCQSYSWSTEQGKWIFQCPCSRLRIWSREAGSAVPSRVSLLIHHTQSESDAYSRDSSRFPRPRPFICLNCHTPFVVVVVVVFTLKTVLTSIQYPSLSYSSRQRNEFPWSHANPK